MDDGDTDEDGDVDRVGVMEMVEQREDWREGCFLKVGMRRALNCGGKGLVVVVFLECCSSVVVSVLGRRRGAMDRTIGAVFLGRGRARNWFAGDARLVGVEVGVEMGCERSVERMLNGFGTVTRRCRLAVVGDGCL